MRIFLTLVRHSLARFMDNEVVSPGGDMQTGWGQALAWVITPGVMLLVLTLPVFDQIRLEIHYLLVSLSFAVLGAVMLLEWDHLFPDRMDALILTPLPLRSGMLFLARLTALAALIGVFLAGANLATAIALPLFTADPRDGVGKMLQSFWAHVAACGGAGLFAALLFATVQGVLLQIFGRFANRWITPALQVVFVAVIMTVLIASPAIALVLRVLVGSHHAALWWFPPFWFVGAYESLMPCKSAPIMAQLAGRAWQALGWTAAAFVLMYLTGYRRHCRNVLDQQVSPARPSRAGWTAFLRNPQERATFHFISRTLWGSARLRLFLACYAGAAAAFSLVSVYSLEMKGPAKVIPVPTADGLLAVPMILTFFLLSGLRVAFNYPVLRDANWIFQLTEDSTGSAHVHAMRKWVLLRAIVPLFVLLIPFELWNWPWRGALFHLAFAFSLALLLREVSFFDFKKVPFTCSYLPPAANLTLLAAIYIFGFTTYAYRMAELESFLADRPGWAVMFFALIAAVLAGCSRLRARQFSLVWEEEPEPAVRVLGL